MCKHKIVFMNLRYPNSLLFTLGNRFTIQKWSQLTVFYYLVVMFVNVGTFYSMPFIFVVIKINYITQLEFHLKIGLR